MRIADAIRGRDFVLCAVVISLGFQIPVLALRTGPLAISFTSLRSDRSLRSLTFRFSKTSQEDSSP